MAQITELVEQLASHHMARAIDLASLAMGRTAPNPAVGAVLVREGRVVGEGYTQPPGGPHAEIVALRQAGQQARGATLYVTLEPCCCHGRTPPCVDELIAAGVTEVRMATLDPNPSVNGQGKRKLESAGIRTHVGEMAGEAEEIIEAFARYITTGRPFVTAKWAMTLDGKIATESGNSRWITGQSARERVHRLRDVQDAILVGVNTVLADDPRLTVKLAGCRLRPPRNHPPLRVVVDSKGRTPLTARLLQPDLASGTLVASTSRSPIEWQKSLQSLGARVLILPEQGGRVDLSALLATLGEMEVAALLVEGGGQVLGSLFRAGQVDKVWAFVAPRIIGGSTAPTPVEGSGVLLVELGWPIKVRRVESVDPDLLIVGYVDKTGGDRCSPG